MCFELLVRVRRLKQGNVILCGFVVVDVRGCSSGHWSPRLSE